MKGTAVRRTGSSRGTTMTVSPMRVKASMRTGPLSGRSASRRSSRVLPIRVKEFTRSESSQFPVMRRSPITQATETVPSPDP